MHGKRCLRLQHALTCSMAGCRTVRRLLPRMQVAGYASAVLHPLIQVCTESAVRFHFFQMLCLIVRSRDTAKCPVE